MNFKPFNRYLLVTPEEEQEEEKNMAIVLPTEYKKPKSPYIFCTVQRVSEDSKFHGSIFDGDRILIERRMLNQIDFNGKSLYLVLENYIYGRINNEIDKATS